MSDTERADRAVAERNRAQAQATAREEDLEHAQADNDKAQRRADAKWKLPPLEPQKLRFTSITQVMSMTLGDPHQPRPVLLGITTSGRPYYFLFTEQGVAGWVPVYDREAVLKPQSEIEAAAEAVATQEEAAEAAEAPKLITGGDANRAMATLKDLERGIK